MISATYVNGRGDDRMARIVQESMKRRYDVGKDGGGGHRGQVLTKTEGKS